MKKIKFITTILILIVSTLILVACNDTKNEPSNTPKEYTITSVSTKDYTITSDKQKAVVGTIINVTITNQNFDNRIEIVKYNDNECTKTEKGYQFTMPAENVTLTATIAPYVEIKIDGMASFSQDNVTTITKNGTHNTESVLDKNKWGLDIIFDTNNMTRLSDEINSNNTSVIPNDAITLKPFKNNMTGRIDNARVYIDTTKIECGTTWITMKFINDNLSGSSAKVATLVIKITVIE